MGRTHWKACLGASALFLVLHSKANDTLVMTRLLQRIEQLQPSSHGVFPKGLFPSYRLYSLNPNRQKADVNGFFTALISFTLRDMLPQLSPGQQQIGQKIIDASIPSFEKFKNRKGRPTYNFWPTDTPQIFPNAGWMNYFNSSQALPDDLDDTVLFLLAINAADSTRKQVHQIMQEFTNSNNKSVKNTFAEYRNIGAYSTWFGKKMPVDFDIAVLSNVLYFVQASDLSWTPADSASLFLIEKVIQEKKHLTDAAYVSPHYNRVPIILYHLSRLMQLKPIPSLDQYKTQLISDTQTALEASSDFMDQILLSTSLLRWGVIPTVTKTHHVGSFNELIEDESFSFFIANMASMLPDPMKQWMGATGVGKFYYHCPAYNHVLLLEYLYWRKKRGLSL